MSDKILVTGGSGFIGSALVKRLVDMGRDVAVLDNNVRGSRAKLGDYIDRVDFTEGDIRDPQVADKAVSGCNVVYHLAYINGTRYFYEVPHVVLEVAVKGTMNIIDAVINNGASKFLFASSSEVYQVPGKIPTDESAELVVPDINNPRYSYGGGKIIGELLTMNYARHNNFDSIIFRPHNVYGPDMGFEHVIPEFARKLHAIKQGDNTFPIEGTGKETRAFCHIDDFIDGLLLVADKGESESVYHLGDDRYELSIEKLAELCLETAGLEAKITLKPEKPGGCPRRCPDISKARELGFTPRVAIEDGLRQTLDWYLMEYERQDKEAR